MNSWLCFAAGVAVMSSDRQRTILDPDIAAALGIGDDDE